MIKSALRYQTQGDDWIKRVLIGGAVVLLANLVFLPLFTVYGYMMEVMRQTLRDETGAPPEWGDYDIVELSIDGAKAFVIQFAYTTGIGLIVLLPSGILLLLSLLLQSRIIGLLSVLVGGVLSLVAVLLIGIVVPVTVGNFVITDDIAAGFDIGMLRSVGTNRKMLRAAAIGIGINFLISILSGVLLITFVGPAIVAFIGFSAIAIIWANGFADAYREIHGELPEIPDGPTKGDAGATATTAGAGAAGADADTTEDTADSGTEPDDADDDSSGPDPTDGNRWD